MSHDWRAPPGRERYPLDRIEAVRRGPELAVGREFRPEARCGGGLRCRAVAVRSPCRRLQ
ncbi:hypothetical protein [Halorussus caseinilyticus]|uniref:Uncharacterized protein n=1 Tax=Halorussus caseinilyticus TaxID=3034025 RepID=A0ABD5WQR8_9EURY